MKIATNEKTHILLHIKTAFKLKYFQMDFFFSKGNILNFQSDAKRKTNYMILNSSLEVIVATEMT